jgi:hypothetical protein
MPPSLEGSVDHVSTAALEVSEMQRPGTIAETGNATATSRLVEAGNAAVCLETVMRFEFAAAKVEQGRRFTFTSTGPTRELTEEEEWLTVRVGILTLQRSREIWRPAAAQ